MAGRGVQNRSFFKEALDNSHDVSENVKRRRTTRPWWILDPRKSSWLVKWDVTTMLAVIFTALVTPYEVAVLEAPSSWQLAVSNPLFVVNRTIDVIFGLDIVLQFFVMVQTFDDREGVKWIDEPRVIWQMYLSSWFALDLFSLVPSAFDIVPLFLDAGGTGRWRQCGNARCQVFAADTSFLGRFKALRVVRVFRLVKLTRLLRASRVLKRWESRMSISFAYLLLLRVTLLYLVSAHWAACLLLLPTQFYDTPVQTWLGHFRYCTSEPTSVTFAFENLLPERHSVSQSTLGEDACNEARGLYDSSDVLMERFIDGTCTARCMQPLQLYIATLYMSLQIICGTSGGSYDSMTYNLQEHIVFSCIVVIGAMLWGYVIGVFVITLNGMNPDIKWYRATLDQLNHFMEVSQLPREMRIRLREFFQQSRHIHRGESRKSLMRLMSPALQGEVCMVINQSWIWSVPFLKGAENDFIVLVSSSMLPAVFAPGEMATSGYLYLIHKGVALYGGRVLVGGHGKTSVFGQDMILQRRSLCRYTGRAMTYLEVYRISRNQLLGLARPFPIACDHIRFEAVRLALQRVLSAVKYAVQRKKEEIRSLSGGLDGELSTPEALMMIGWRVGQTPGNSPEALRSKGWNNFLGSSSEQPQWVNTIQADGNPKAAGPHADEPPTTSDLASRLDKLVQEVGKVGLAVSALGVVKPNPEPEATPQPPLATPSRAWFMPHLPATPSAPLDNQASATATATQNSDTQSLLNEMLAGQAALRKELHAVRSELGNQGKRGTEVADDVRTLKAWIVTDVLSKLHA